MVSIPGRPDPNLRPEQVLPDHSDEVHLVMLKRLQLQSLWQYDHHHNDHYLHFHHRLWKFRG